MICTCILIINQKNQKKIKIRHHKKQQQQRSQQQNGLVWFGLVCLVRFAWARLLVFSFVWFI